MTQAVNVVFLDMPVRIRAYTVANPDLSYTVVINSRLAWEQQRESYKHEIEHIRNKDFGRSASADLIEIFAHR